MGNGFSSSVLFSARQSRTAEGRRSIVDSWMREDETQGHSFRYVRRSSSSPRRSSAASSSSRRLGRQDSVPRRTIGAISGAVVSGNSSTRPIHIRAQTFRDESAASPAPSNPPGFEGSCSFSAAPLQLSSPAATAVSSVPVDRSVSLPGHIGRGELSELRDSCGVPLSASPASKIDERKSRGVFPVSDYPLLRRASLFLRRGFSERIRPLSIPVRDRQRSFMQWGHSKAGEDRVHVVVSEEHRWLFVGIYDGFNGSDTAEFLVASLYRSLSNQLEGLCGGNVQELQDSGDRCRKKKQPLHDFLADRKDDQVPRASDSISNCFMFLPWNLTNRFGRRQRQRHRMEFLQWRRGEEGQYKATGEATSQERGKTWKPNHAVDHGLVLEALSRALEITEVEYLERLDIEIRQNPELALTGSCVLIVLMRDEDVYVMNVGDSRAIIAQHRPAENSKDVFTSEEDIVEEVGCGVQREHPAMELVALQLSTDHSTSIEDEVRRIREEHPDDSKCVVNNKVKGRLRVTRAFGAGYLKQPKWNDGLLEIFRSEYIGTAPYISSSPSLCHHKLCQSDQFLVLSSDGLYQYLTNEEVVSHVKTFMERFPDGDPAQSLIKEVIVRAANKAGMDFNELLGVPQGDRRKYHDDVSVIVVSLEGRMWESSR
ncbi:unnamed protein product [Spirodela intermedia]|uniref:protein-serine/threonine phosphatase n=1 Tax=Spirodela intermedia TaxID=51605 RepID=A0A7I8JHN5_SPIIN|nr:unnamed protein product [Spirodela intermedia]CAA6669679.1 unnamed protein product [Spirodela intermedia]